VLEAAFDPSRKAAGDGGRAVGSGSACSAAELDGDCLLRVEFKRSLIGWTNPSATGGACQTEMRQL